MQTDANFGIYWPHYLNLWPSEQKHEERSGNAQWHNWTPSLKYMKAAVLCYGEKRTGRKPWCQCQSVGTKLRKLRDNSVTVVLKLVGWMGGSQHAMQRSQMRRRISHTRLASDAHRWQLEIDSWLTAATALAVKFSASVSHRSPAAVPDIRARGPCGRWCGLSRWYTGSCCCGRCSPSHCRRLYIDPAFPDRKVSVMVHAPNELHSQSWGVEEVTIPHYFLFSLRCPLLLRASTFRMTGKVQAAARAQRLAAKHVL